MRKEDIHSELELNESIDALGYLVKKGIEPSIVFERDNHQVGFDDLLEEAADLDKLEAMAHKVVIMAFLSMPIAGIEEESKKLKEAFDYTKRNILLGMYKDNMGDYSDEEINEVRNFSIGDIALLAHGKFKRYDLAKSTPGITPEEAYKRDSMALYWLRVKTIAMAGHVLSEDQEAA